MSRCCPLCFSPTEKYVDIVEIDGVNMPLLFYRCVSTYCESEYGDADITKWNKLIKEAMSKFYEER